MPEEEERGSFRRDLNIWEKRIAIYLLTALVGVSTNAIVNMRTEVRLANEGIIYLKEADANHAASIAILTINQQGLIIEQKGHCDKIAHNAENIGQLKGKVRYVREKLNEMKKLNEIRVSKNSAMDLHKLP